MKNVKNIIIIIILLLFTIINSYAQGTIEQLVDNGPTSKRLNIVILSEGYTSSEKSKFISDATSSLNKILYEKPFSEYKTYFNGFAIFVSSNESGSDHPSKNIYKDTYFNSTYESNGVGTQIALPGNNMSKVTQLLQKLIPEYNIVLLLVNDSLDGGAGGTLLISSTYGVSMEKAVHELGHKFGGLYEEYSSASTFSQGGEGPNTTAETRREYIKWKAWIEPTTLIPTPSQNLYQSTVGLFEGACYSATGWYRPKLNCKMRTLYYQFCEVCGEKIVKTIYNFVKPIDSFYPTEKSIWLDSSITLSIDSKKPVNHSLSIQWYMNGNAIKGATLPSFKLTREQMIDTIITIEGKVTDITDLVRTYDSPNLSDSISWIVRKNPTALLSAPVLAYPANNIIGVSSKPTFAWNAVNTSISYNLKVSKNDTNWAAPVIDINGITQTFYTSEISLKPGMTYFWKVNSSNGIVTSDWSNIWQFTTSLATSVDELKPIRFELKQNYPNPFNPFTVIGYNLPYHGYVSLKIHDLIGREITNLVSQIQEAGFHQIEWNANGIPSGIYYYRLQAGEFIETKKLILMR